MVLSSPRILTLLAFAALTTLSASAQPMRTFLETYQADLDAIRRFYKLETSPWALDRWQAFYESKAKELQAIKFEKLDRAEKADYILASRLLDLRRKEVDQARAQRGSVDGLAPFLPQLESLIIARQKMEKMDGEQAARDLDTIVKSVDKAREALKAMKIGDRTIPNRAANLIEKMRGELREWFEFYEGYDPLFTWWTKKPYEAAQAEIGSYAQHLKTNLVEVDPEDKNAIIGNPVGEAALMDSLRAEGIPYNPTELMAIAKKEYAWCEAEMIKASEELGFGKDWRKALEHVKGLHVSPGEQPNLIKNLADEAIEFLEKNDLVTVPPLAKETWRMFMMSPERQKVSPFFLGGESIIVSFPTDTMSHDEKMMSLRSNNIHFARATVHHELFPGHHLQFYSEQRYRPYRRVFDTPFWTEGWALWFEFLFWDMGFPKGPENKIGMLFWRMHRCVRIEFSLGFHLGKLTPEECIKMLVEKVGHEPSTAEGEVRRSFAGDYPPLYQAAYMLGALQFRRLSKELVDSGKMTRKQFHDAVMRENNMPIAMLRAVLNGTELTKDFDPSWRFYD